MSRYTVSDPPDPATASSATEFVAVLRELRLWAGQPSLRRIRHLAGTTSNGSRGMQIDTLPESTTSYTLRGVRLPRADFVRSFVAACLRSRDREWAEVGEWVERWQDVWLHVVAGGPAEAADRHANHYVRIREAAGLSRRGRRQAGSAELARNGQARYRRVAGTSPMPGGVGGPGRPRSA